LFRLLGLLHSGEDFERLYRGLKSRNAKVRASSRELLENLLRPPLRDAVLALVDDAPADKRLAAAADFVGFLPTSYERLLGALLDEGDETVRSLAAYHAGELGLSGLRPRLDAFQVQGATPSFAAVLERALALMTTRASPASRAAGAGSNGF
jgi:hypothetical protein